MMKQALRKSVMARVASLSAAKMDSQAGAVAHSVRHNPIYLAANTVAMFANLPKNELPTERLLANAYRDGKRVFLPHMVSLEPAERTWAAQKQHICMRELDSMVEINALKPRGLYNIREPTTGLDALDRAAGGPGLDLIIVPGVAFTKECKRLGHGGGFYDAYIAEHERRTGRRPFLLAVGFEEQLVEDIPSEGHDELVDIVALGDGSVYLRPGLEEMMGEASACSAHNSENHGLHNQLTGGFEQVLGHGMQLSPQ